MRNSNANNASKAGWGLTPLILLALVGVTGGIIAIVWSAVESLHENQVKLKQYKVEPAIRFLPKSTEAQGMDALEKRFGLAQVHVQSEALLDQARKLVSLKNYKEAIATGKKSIETYEKESGSNALDALDMIQIASREDLISWCYLQLHDFPNALAYANKSVSRRPARAEAFTNRAAVHTAMGSADLAAKDSAMAQKFTITINDQAAISEYMKNPNRIKRTLESMDPH